MTDERKLERVSRYLDDDLGAEERARMEEDLRRDPQLAELVHDLRELRSAVRQCSDAMQPPAELDALLEPLRRARPRSRGVRPAYRYLAAAAMVAMAFTLGLQVAKRNPGSTLESLDAPRRVHPPLGGGEVFKLQPLPTASAEEREMVGASDRLLAQPPPDPTMDEPQPLHIMGPLAEPEESAGLSVAGKLHDEATTNEAQQRHAAPREEVDADGSARMRRRAAQKSVETATFAPAPGDTPARAVRDARIVIGGVSVDCAACRELDEGNGQLVITVHATRIAQCRGVDREDEWISSVCSALTALQVDDLEDGSHSATVEIKDAIHSQ